MGTNEIYKNPDENHVQSCMNIHEAGVVVVASRDTPPALQPSPEQTHKIPLIVLSFTLSSSALAYEPIMFLTSYSLHPSSVASKTSYPNIFS